MSQAIIVNIVLVAPDDMSNEYVQSHKAGIESAITAVVKNDDGEIAEIYSVRLTQEEGGLGITVHGVGDVVGEASDDFHCVIATFIDEREKP